MHGPDAAFHSYKGMESCQKTSLHPTSHLQAPRLLRGVHTDVEIGLHAADTACALDVHVFAHRRLHAS